jgi:hypothetical protein
LGQDLPGCLHIYLPHKISIAIEKIIYVALLGPVVYPWLPVHWSVQAYIDNANLRKRDHVTAVEAHIAPIHWPGKLCRSAWRNPRNAQLAQLPIATFDLHRPLFWLFLWPHCTYQSIALLSVNEAQALHRMIYYFPQWNHQSQADTETENL